MTFDLSNEIWLVDNFMDESELRNNRNLKKQRLLTIV